MKAIVYHRHGPPEVLQLEEVAKPVPGDGEVLVRVHAVGLNPYDRHAIFGEPRIMRRFLGPLPKIAGTDFAGEVEAVGSGVTDFAPGDAVFGCSKAGALAEYACTTMARLARKPENVTFEQAATLPIAGTTALQGLRDFARLQAGQRVLINGAAGGVGTFAVQIAKALGAEVTGVCSTGNVELVRGIGADDVVDYTREDFTRGAARYDAILDNVGTHSFAEYRRVLQRSGVAVLVGATKGRMGRAVGGLIRYLLSSPFIPQKLTICRTKLRADDLSALGALVAEGKVVPAIERRYSLAESAEAIRYIDSGHARGKVVVTL
jgi:NADPH:quinone reductase-like Zn-dependent oxidoreductase